MLSGSVAIWLQQCLREICEMRSKLRTLFLICEAKFANLTFKVVKPELPEAATRGVLYRTISKNTIFTEHFWTAASKFFVNIGVSTYSQYEQSKEYRQFLFI